LGTQDFWRLRIGVGRPAQSNQVEHYVLAAPTKEEKKIIDNGLTRAKNIMPLLLKADFQQAMNLLHTPEEI
jgi:PTH1 family peptidyl-tRNA hydrolase